MTNGQRELKAVSLRFRDWVSRALRSDNADARVNLRRLLAFVNDTPLLRSEIERVPLPQIDVLASWNDARNHRNKLSMPDDPAEELGLLHALLTELAAPSGGDFWDLCWGYGGETGLNESVSSVLHDLVGKYEGHLRQAIEMALLESNDPAYDSRRIDIHVSGGTNQLNVAQDQAKLQAAMHASPEAGEALRLARELVAAAVKARSEGVSEAEELEEVASAVVEQLEKPKPSRFTLRSAREKLESLAAVTNTVGTLAVQAQQVAVAVGGLLNNLPQ